MIPKSLLSFIFLMWSTIVLAADFGAHDLASMPKANSGPEWVLIDDYSNGTFAGGFSDGQGSTISVERPSVGGTASLVIDYTLRDGGWAGIWHQVGMAWNQPQEWAGFRQLVVAMHTTEPVTCSPMIQITKDLQCRGSSFTTAGTGWQLVILDAAIFAGLPGTIETVEQICFHFQTPGNHVVRLGWIQALRDPSAVKDWVDLNVFRVVNERPVPPIRRATFHVSTGGDDAGPGTAQQPWRTVNRGVRDLQPGDTLTIHAGLYVEEVGDGQHQAGALVTISGLPDAPIRIVGEGFPRLTSATWGTIRIQDSCHLEIEGLDVTTSEFPWEGTRQNLGNGIFVERSHHIVIRNNRVHDCGGGGIAVMHSDYISILNNLTKANSFYMKWQGSGISLYQARDFDREPGTRNVISGNISFLNENRVPTDAGEFTDGNGIIIDDFRNTQGAGPHVAYKGSTAVFNNLCFNNGGRGVHVFLADNVDVMHNTCVDNGRTLKNVADLSIWFSADVRVAHNIASSRDGSVALQVERSNRVAVWGNVFHRGAVPSQWMAGNRQADPLFLKAGPYETADFRVASTSPAIDAANGDLSAPFDLRGNVRPQGSASDAGAFERQSTDP